MDESNWTAKEEEIVDRHFQAKRAVKGEKQISAGKTSGLDDKTFGLGILEAGSEAEAMDIMRDDSAVTEGMMKAELFPCHVALIGN